MLHSRHLAEEFVKKYRLLPQLLPNATEHATLWFAVDKFRDNGPEDHRGPGHQTTTSRSTGTTGRGGALGKRLRGARQRDPAQPALTDSSRNIQYLKDQIAKTDVVEMQRCHVQPRRERDEDADARERAQRVRVHGRRSGESLPKRRVWPRRTLIVADAAASSA